MELTGDMPVTLVIKAPSQRMDDQVIDCVPSWTIRKLKEHLETVYPSRPKYNEQRLIYSGRLLQDQLTLKDILRQYDSSSTSNRYTLHLVCSSTSESQTISKTPDTVKQSVANAVTTTPASNAPEVNSTPASDTTSVDSVPAGTSTTVPAGDGLRHRGSQQVNTSTAPNIATNPGAYMYPGFYPSAYNPYMTATSGSTNNAAEGEGNTFNSQHYTMMMQQMYAQYMMQYAQFYQSTYNPAMLGAQPASPVGQPWFQPYPPHLQREELTRPPAAEAPAGDAGANRGGAAPRQNIRMNAQGGMEEDEDDDGEPRDWLHHTYFMMRVLTFVGILFFYSNLTRFLVVFSGGFVVYFLLKLRKYMLRRERELQQQQRQEQEQRQEQQPQQQENVSPNVQQNNEEVHENNEDGGTPETDQNQTNEQVAEEEGGRVARLFLFACNTVQAFFTSLLPNPPEILDPN